MTVSVRVVVQPSQFASFRIDVTVDDAGRIETFNRLLAHFFVFLSSFQRL
jgi:hypothetical protein